MVILLNYSKGSNVKVSANFEAQEFDCKCKSCASTEIDNNLVEILQKIRDYFGKPVHINSAYRCAKHNKSVGGASKSKHLYGQAADIKITGVKPVEIAKYAEYIGVKGIGLYSNFVHVDTRTNKFFWYGNEQSPRTTFGGTTIKEEEPVNTGNNKYIQITGASVNIRKGPGTEFSSAGTAKRNQKFKIIDIPEKWIPVEIDGEVRFISSTYTKEI